MDRQGLRLQERRLRPAYADLLQQGLQVHHLRPAYGDRLPERCLKPTCVGLWLPLSLRQVYAELRHPLLVALKSQRGDAACGLPQRHRLLLSSAAGAQCRRKSSEVSEHSPHRKKSSAG